MKRYALAAVAVVALAGTWTAAAAQTPILKEGSAIVAPPDPCARHPRPAAEQRTLAGEVLALSRWQHPAVGGRAIAAMRVLRGCADRQTRESMARAWHAAKDDLALQRRYRLLAVYPGFEGEGRFLRWLVIPSWVVAAETSECGGRATAREAGECRWLIVNTSGSGACGPYQLLGHTSCDTSSAADKMRHHEIAAGLPRGSWAVGY